MRRCVVFIAALIAPLTASAQSARADLQQYVDGRTMMAAQADLTKIDPVALETWMRQMMAASGMTTGPFALKPEQVDAQMAFVRKWLGDVVAAGGKEIYTVSWDDVSHGPPVAVILPAAPGGDVNKLASLLADGGPDGPMSAPQKNRQLLGPGSRDWVQVLNDNLVVAGGANAINYIKNLKPAPRPDITEALTAAGDSPIKIAIAPTFSIRNLIMTQLPPTIFGQPSSVVTQDLKWIAFGDTPPPAASVKVIVHASDPAKAQALDHIVTFGLAALSGVPPTISPDLAKMLTPQVNGSDLVLTADNAKLLAIAKEVGPQVMEARRQAMLAQSLSLERQIVMACQMYANDHKGIWPDDLKATQKYIRNPRMLSGFVYLKPTAPTNRPSETPVLYESHKEFGSGVAVAFADGHCEFVANKQRFDDLIAKAALDAEPQ